MKIYFQASILDKDRSEVVYKRIISFLKDSGHVVLGETLFLSIDDIKSRTKSDRDNYWKSFKKNLFEADIVCMELTYPSTLHMGLKLAYAIAKNKPVIGIYKKNEYPDSFLDVLETDKFIYQEYNDENLETVLQSALDFVDKKSDTRFNFYLPSEQMDYLDSVSKDKSITRTAVLRRIIDAAMGKSEVS